MWHRYCVYYDQNITRHHFHRCIVDYKHYKLTVQTGGGITLTIKLILALAAVTLYHETSPQNAAKIVELQSIKNAASTELSCRPLCCRVAY